MHATTACTMETLLGDSFFKLGIFGCLEKKMNTLIPHQRLSCRPTDFILSQFQQYNEKYLRRFIAKKYLQWTSSARAGISQLLSPSERVGIPSFTCSVVATAVTHAGAVPVFIDSGVIAKAEDIEKHITKIDTLLLPYNFGFMPQMDKITALCRKHKVRLIEDCAQAIGATSGGKLAGSFGEAAVYSFGISKNIGFFGGMVATDTQFFYKGKFCPIIPRYKSYAEAFLGNIFFNPYVYRWTEPLLKLGFTKETVIPYTVPDFAKYVVLAQARHYERMLALRRSNAAYLMRELAGCVEFVTPEAGTEPAWLYFALLHNNRDALRTRLLNGGIDIRPLHTFGDVSKNSRKSADIEHRHLAFALLRQRAEIEEIAHAIKQAIKNEARH